MLTFDAWQFPDGERHLPEWMTRADHRVDGRLTYQYHKYEPALALCRQRRVAVDIGAHVGLWSYWMARDFARLHAFEPRPEHCACWRVNVPPSEAVTLHEVALGETADRVGLKVSVDSSGNTRIAPPVTVSAKPRVRNIEMRTLDSFGLDDIDFMKIDVEGFEYFVVAGGRETIARCRPVVIVEQKPRFSRAYGRKRPEDAARLLESLGARVVQNIGGDFVMSFEAA